jgi:DNA-binding transcriptional MocR family regulator
MAAAIDVTQSHAAPDVIDFGLGHPARDLLPLDMMREAAQRCLASGDPDFLQYGLEQGSPYLRVALAAFLGEAYGAPVAPERLFVSNGVSQALDLLCTLFTQPGDVVLVEEPTYFLALRIFADHRLRVVSVAMDEHGLLPGAVEEAAHLHRPRLLYTIPTHQNPTGITLAAERRARLVEWSRAHGFLIVADEVYHLLSYGAPPPPPFAAWADGGSVIALGSFSKILAPGLRLGWVQAAPEHVQRLAGSGLLDSGGGLNPFTSAIVGSALETGLQARHLARLKSVYRQRVAALDAALRAHLGGAASWAMPEGGYFFWLRLPDGTDAERLAPHAAAHKVGFRAGARFSSCDGLHNHVRLSFPYYDDDQLAEGAARLGRALRAAT